MTARVECERLSAVVFGNRSRIPCPRVGRWGTQVVGWRVGLGLGDFVTRRPCWVEISTDAFEGNYRLLAGERGGAEDAAPVELLAIVKADAYGHSVEVCGPAAVRAGARWLGVTSVEEGVKARAACSELEAEAFGPVEILVIGGVFWGQGEAVVEHRLTPVVWERWQIAELEDAAERVGAGEVRVHLELDTGMSRQGVGADGLEGILGCFGPDAAVRLAGVMTHLFAADESDGVVTRGQFERLAGMLSKIAERSLGVGLWLHVGNSAAVLSGEPVGMLRELAGRFGMRAMVRPGLALYGLAPGFEPDEPEAVKALRGRLRPVLSWKTRVTSVRAIEAGAVVGYNGTFVASEPMVVALLAVGYADGLKRAVAGKGWVLVRGERAPFVGRVSMDQAVVDVTEISGVEAGDEVVLIGAQGSDGISAEDHAGWAGTIAWEVFTSITQRVERIGAS